MIGENPIAISHNLRCEREIYNEYNRKDMFKDPMLHSFKSPLKKNSIEELSSSLDMILLENELDVYTGLVDVYDKLRHLPKSASLFVGDQYIKKIISFLDPNTKYDMSLTALSVLSELFINENDSTISQILLHYNILEYISYFLSNGENKHVFYSLLIIINNSPCSKSFRNNVYEKGIYQQIIDNVSPLLDLLKYQIKALINALVVGSYPNGLVEVVIEALVGFAQNDNKYSKYVIDAITLAIQHSSDEWSNVVESTKFLYNIDDLFIIKPKKAEQIYNVLSHCNFNKELVSQLYSSQILDRISTSFEDGNLNEEILLLIGDFLIFLFCDLEDYEQTDERDFLLNKFFQPSIEIFFHFSYTLKNKGVHLISLFICAANYEQIQNALSEQIITEMVNLIQIEDPNQSIRIIKAMIEIFNKCSNDLNILTSIAGIFTQNITYDDFIEFSRNDFEEFNDNVELLSQLIIQYSTESND